MDWYSRIGLGKLHDGSDLRGFVLCPRIQII